MSGTAALMLQAQSVFRTFESFHILLRYSLILKWIHFFPAIYTKPHNEKQKTIQYIYFLQMYLKYKKINTLFQ